MLKKKGIKIDHLSPIVRLLNDKLAEGKIFESIYEVGDNISIKLAQKINAKRLFSPDKNVKHYAQLADELVDLCIVKSSMPIDELMDLRWICAPGGYIVIYGTDIPDLVEANLIKIKEEKSGKYDYVLAKAIPQFDSPNSETYFRAKLMQILSGPRSASIKNYTRDMYSSEEWKAIVYGIFARALDNSTELISIPFVDAIITWEKSTNYFLVTYYQKKSHHLIHAEVVFIVSKFRLSIITK